MYINFYIENRLGGEGMDDKLISKDNINYIGIIDYLIDNFVLPSISKEEEPKKSSTDESEEK